MSESERESWLCSLDGEEEGLNKFIAHSGYLITLVPNAQERLRDIQAEKQFVQTAPEEVIGELMPKIFPFQKDAEKRLQNVTITFPQDSHFYTEAIVTTSGSLLPMQEITETVLSQAPNTR